MITFLDGPAAREHLMCRRAPLFLRVVFNPRKRSDAWDALDQLNDQPKPSEQLHAYVRESPATWMHIKGTRKCTSGIYAVARYRLCETQPPDAVMRDTGLWQQWCRDAVTPK